MYCCQYGYPASQEGWDPVTGLGTPNMLEIENYIRNISGLPSVAKEAALANNSSMPPPPNMGGLMSADSKSVSPGGAVGIAIGSVLVGLFIGFVAGRSRSRAALKTSGAAPLMEVSTTHSRN